MDTQYAQDKALNYFSKGYHGLYCEACRDSTHAGALSREARDAIKFISVKGYEATLDKCTTCHFTQAEGAIHE